MPPDPAPPFVFLIFGDGLQLVTLAEAGIARRLRQLNRPLHLDFSPHKFALLIGGGLGLLQHHTLRLRRLFLRKRLGELGRQLLTPYRHQQFWRNGRLTQPLPRGS